MAKQWKWYVYIIRCQDGLYYTGLTWDLTQRLEQHLSGKGSTFTSKHGVDKLVYAEQHDDLLLARNRERQIKDFSRKKKETLIASFTGI